jgi:thioredoxin 1
VKDGYTVKKSGKGREPVMSDQWVITVTDEDFEERVLKAEGVSVVDFWAPWCGPCLTMAPGLEAFALKHKERINVFKVDADDNPKTAEKYEIRSIPTLLFIKDGEVFDTHTGALSEAGLEERLSQLTGGAS